MVYLYRLQQRRCSIAHGSKYLGTRQKVNWRQSASPAGGTDQGASNDPKPTNENVKLGWRVRDMATNTTSTAQQLQSITLSDWVRLEHFAVDVDVFHINHLSFYPSQDSYSGSYKNCFLNGISFCLAFLLCLLKQLGYLAIMLSVASFTLSGAIWVDRDW